MTRLRSAETILVVSFALVAAIALLGARPRSERILAPRDIQETPGDASPRVGELLHVEGVVAAVSPHGAFFYLAEPAGGPWSGVKVDGPSIDRVPGEFVTVVGEVIEASGETRIVARHVSPRGTAPLPPPVDLTVAALQADPEPWEGVLVRIHDVTVETETSQYGEFDLGDATAGGLEVDDEFFTWYIADPGDTFDSFAGILAYGFSDFHLEPRGDRDLVGWESGRDFDGLVRVTVVDDRAQPLPSRVTFFRVGGGGLDLGPDDRAEATEDVAYLALGEGEIRVPSGAYDVYVSRGIEYGLYHEQVDVPSGGMATLHATLHPEVDTSAWISADFHLHSAPSSDTPLPVPGRVASLVGEGVEWAVATDHNMVTDYSPVIESMGLTDWIRSSVGQEITTRSPSFGHFNAWPIRPGSPPRPFEGLDPEALFAGARTGPDDEIVQVN
ncbi:MAG TPA: hypothetical protein VKU85_16625, partial [bacterium]|nr:hypothetical protein [bacterium]